MMQMLMDSFMNYKRPYGVQGTNMPSANKAVWFSFACLKKAGSGGYLGPGVLLRIPGGTDLIEV